MTSQVALVVKSLPANAGDIRHAGSIPGSGRSPGEGNGNSLQYSCLENSMDRGAWQAAVHTVAKSRKGLSDLACTCAGSYLKFHSTSNFLKYFHIYSMYAILK